MVEAFPQGQCHHDFCPGLIELLDTVVDQLDVEQVIPCLEDVDRKCNLSFFVNMIVSTVLPGLVPQQRIDNCVVIHIPYWELCDPLYHQNFRSGHDCASAFSGRSPRNLGSQADIANSVIREVNEDTLLARYHFCSRL